MNIAVNTTVSKLFVAFVAVAMLFTVAAPAKAATVEELQAQIAALMAQISSLSGGSSAPAAGCTFTRALTTGSTGADVTCLQNYLIGAGHAISAGATGYFGSQTAAAVASWQAANGVMPAAGYFGPVSQAKYNALMAANPSTPGEDDSDDDSSTGELSGEADLDSADLEDGESSVEEGDEDVVVGVFTAEFRDGDAEISRMDFTFVGGPSNNGEPWEAFDTISLWVDGEEVASMDASDEDDYLDEDAGEIRFSGLDIVAMEDEEIEIEIAVSVQNNLDAAELGNWTVDATSLRFFDADGVATTETGSDLDGTSEFEVEVAGSGEELKVSLASNNPAATDIVVDTDTDTDDVTIMIGELEAEDNDIELDDFVLLVQTTGATTTDVVDEVSVVIDGQEFKAEAIGTETDYSASADQASLNGLSQGYSERASATTSVWYFFDIDGDVTLAEGEEVEFEVVVDLNDTDDGARYGNNTKIKAEVTSVERNEWSAEGAEDLTSGQFKGTAVGKEHTLVAEGITVPADDFSYTFERTNETGTIGEFKVKFDVSAVEGDFYLAKTATTSTAVTSGIVYAVTGSATTITGTLTSTADEDTSGVFTVREGESETFTLTVTIDAATAGGFEVALSELWYTENADGVTSTEDYLPTPVQDYRTDAETIN